MTTGDVAKPLDGPVELPALRQSWFGWADVFKLLLAAVIAVVSTVSTNKQQAGESQKQLDDLTRKVAVIEARQEAMMREIVPRNEHLANWKAIENEQRQTREDVRELRALILRRQ